MESPSENQYELWKMIRPQEKKFQVGHFSKHKSRKLRDLSFFELNVFHSGQLLKIAALYMAWMGFCLIDIPGRSASEYPCSM